MRYQGPLFQWNDEKGYGFVEPNGGGTRAFVHRREFLDRSRHPAIGDLLIYKLGKDDQGRPVAREICYVRGETPETLLAARRMSYLAPLFTLLFCLLLAGLTATGVLPIPVALLYTGMSLLAWLLYLFDKARALQNGERIPERTLLLCGLCGGWPGALFAQRQLRHKTRKGAFLRLFWLTVLLNCSLLAGLWFLFSDAHLPPWLLTLIPH